MKGFKCFLIESGVDEFPCVNEEEVLIAMPELQVSFFCRTPYLPLTRLNFVQAANSLFLFHAELAPTCHDSTPAPSIEELPPTSYSTFLESRPQSLELTAISLVARCAAKFPLVKTHIVHLSAASALPLIRETKSKGLPMTVETCFHYLVLSSEQIAKGNTLYKCCPPIREESNRDLLWSALKDGTIDFVVSDHSPCTVELKKLEDGDFMKAWGGIGGLGLGLSLLWTESKKRGVGMEKMLDWLAVRPAKQVGLEESKGRLRVGGDADYVVFDPKKKFIVSGLFTSIADSD